MNKQKTFEDLYIEQNAPTIAENCIKNFLWNGTSFSESIHRREDDERDFFKQASPEKLTQAVKRICRGFYFADALKDFLDNRRKLIIAPYIKNVKEYLRNEYEYSGSVENLSALIRIETMDI